MTAKKTTPRTTQSKCLTPYHALLLSLFFILLLGLLLIVLGFLYGTPPMSSFMAPFTVALPL